MPKWIHIPADPIKEQPYQSGFWNAIQERVCQSCKTIYLCPPQTACATCGKPGIRMFHRLTMLSGRRGGKTLAGSIAAVREASIPGTTGWACAPTNPKLHRYVIPAFQKIIPPDWVRSWSSEFNDLWLKNGSLIHFQTLEDPDQGRGQGLDWLWIDEVCELTEDHWHVIRPSLTEKRGVAFFTSSPRSYDWVYDNFYKRAEDRIPGYWATRYATSENPIISKDELDEAKATMPDAMFRQEYEADFVVFTGSVYDALNDTHLLRTKEQIQQVIPEWPDIAAWRQTLIGIDTGADHPFGAVKLVSCEKGLVVIGEYLERHRSFVQHATEIKRLAGAGNPKYAINRNERQPIIELAQHGIFCQSAENDQIAGIERVKSWLHAKQLFFVVDRCPRTVKQMKAYRWAPDKQKDGQVRKEKVYKKDDELPDCLRYALMTWPVLPRSAPKAEQPLRDLSKLPQDYRMTIERMRKIDGIMAGKAATAKGFGWDEFEESEELLKQRREGRTGLGDDFWGA